MAASARLASVARPVWATRPGRGEAIFAAAAFAVLCVAVLRVAPMLVEPDDWAYRASIVGVTEGHLATLTSSQVGALSAHLASLMGGNAEVSVQGPRLVNIAQWVRLPDGHWISEKDPGYPYLAAPFQAIGLIRFAPLFYGALACAGLFAGARRWLGHFGGVAAVGLYCSSGAALLFAWRDYMPTFTDASLIAAGAGALLWALLAEDASSRRRRWAGLGGFIALELATFARYTDVVVLGCAVVVIALLRWRRPATLPPGALPWWLGSAVLFGAGVATFDTLVYGGPLRSGYQPGEIRFTLGSVLPNLRNMPAHLLKAMPFLLLGVAALAWIAIRWLRLRLRRGRAVVVAGPGAVSPSAAGASAAGASAADNPAAGVSAADNPAAGVSAAGASAAGNPAAGVSAAGNPAGSTPAAIRRDATVGVALGAAWLAIWGLYALYNWTAYPGLSTLQSVRFYVPALGPIALLAAWLVTRIPGRPTAAALTATAVVAGLFGLGIWSFSTMTSFRLGPPHLVHGQPPPRPGHPGGRTRPGAG